MNIFQKSAAMLKHFTVMDAGILKLNLFSIGVLAGIYFYSFFNDLRVLLWIVFILSWLYIVIKVFGFYWNKE